MLQTLKIENVALIDNLTVDFNKGLNILLGETGSGKSLIFNSILFVLGSKSDKTLIRNGKDFMRVEALFVNLSNQVKDFLNQSGFEIDDELLISRSYFLDNRNVIRINNSIATSSFLKSLGILLADCYTQHESVDLLKNKNHLSMLDKFGGNELQVIKEEIFKLLADRKDLEKRIQDLGGNDADRERLISILRYQIEEIESADLQIGEDEEINQRLKILNSAEKIYEAVSCCENLLSANVDSVVNSLQECSAQLSALSAIEDLEKLKERLDSCRYEIEDINQSLIDLRDTTNFDEKEFEHLDSRKDLIKNLNKKYGGTIENVLAFLKSAKEKMSMLEDGEFALEKLKVEMKKTNNQLWTLAEKLSNLRKDLAKEVEEKVVSQLKDLGMKSSKFTINFVKLENVGNNGQDEVKFSFSANAGQEVKELSKTASGGELSRFMLAIKNIFAENGSSDLMLFDEIDSGISGETGRVVGKKLKNITNFTQVLCITHLPQVASFGDNFINVFKIESNGQTYSNAKILQGEEIAVAIAKMTGGNEPSQLAISHANELIKQAKEN